MAVMLAMLTDMRAVHSLKAPFAGNAEPRPGLTPPSMVVTLSMLIDTREVQCSKASLLRVVTPSGTSTCPFLSGVYRQPPSTRMAVASTSSSRMAEQVRAEQERPEQALPLLEDDVHLRAPSLASLRASDSVRAPSIDSSQPRKYDSSEPPKD